MLPTPIARASSARLMAIHLVIGFNASVGMGVSRKGHLLPYTFVYARTEGSACPGSRRRVVLLVIVGGYGPLALWPRLDASANLF